jgi:hypothetical protein
VGEITETVEVRGDTPLLESKTAALGLNIGGDLQRALTLVPGVNTQQARFQGYFLFGTSRTSGVALIDGADATSVILRPGQSSALGSCRLRASTLERNDLAMAIRTLGDELATDASTAQPPTLSVAVEGQTRDLHPIVRDDICKIAAEALRNAFRHAQARKVEVEIRYDDEQFRLRVRDDGRGIDREVLARQGIDGHYGLRGMPERADLIGGKLAVWSEGGMGTEVELHLPANVIYLTSSRRSWLSRLFASRRSA